LTTITNGVHPAKSQEHTNTEAENPNGVQFGSIEHKPEFSAPDPLQAICAAMDQFCESAPPHDDRTLLVIERTA
jgi:hypothetical protein